MTDFEKGLHEVADHLQLDDTAHAQFVGGGLAMVDALTAIRDGHPWRGHATPQAIAGALLEGMTP